MTYEQIEALVARRTDAADRAYLARTMSEAEYRDQMKKIDRWYEAAMKKMTKVAA